AIGGAEGDVERAQQRGAKLVQFPLAELQQGLGVVFERQDADVWRIEPEFILIRERARQAVRQQDRLAGFDEGAQFAWQAGVIEGVDREEGGWGVRGKLVAGDQWQAHHTEEIEHALFVLRMAVWGFVSGQADDGAAAELPGN